jgi:hypothetical protein
LNMKSFLSFQMHQAAIMNRSMKYGPWKLCRCWCSISTIDPWFSHCIPITYHLVVLEVHSKNKCMLVSYTCLGHSSQWWFGIILVPLSYYISIIFICFDTIVMTI